MPIPQKTVTHNPEALLQRIKNSFPALYWSSYEYIDQGWDHEVIILEHKTVFRFPNTNDYLKQLKNEIIILEQLNPLIDIKIPLYKYIPKDISFAGYNIIPGEVLSVEAFRSLDKAEVSTIANQLASFMSTLHSLINNGHSFPSLPPSDIKDTEPNLRSKAELYLPSKVSNEEFEIVKQILDDMDELLNRPLPSVFIHGDILSRHLFWDVPSKELGLIDFSDMNLGDPAFDFNELYEYGKDFVNEVYGYYKVKKDDSFLDRAWTYQRWTGVYMMVNYFETHKIPFEEAKKTFDQVKNGLI